MGEKGEKAIPWHLRPSAYLSAWFYPFITIFLAIGFGGGNAIGKAIVLITYAICLAYFFSWPFLLYRYLAPMALDGSVHRPDRNNFLIGVMGISFAFLAVLAALGYTRLESNEPTDLLVFPILIPFLLIIWRTADLLVEIENNVFGKEQKRYVFNAFVAIFYSILGVFWIHSRLRKLNDVRA